MTDRKNVINLNIKGFSVQGRLEIYPWLIILIISWPPLASLTSNLSSPIFKGKVPQITSLTKNFNSTEMSRRSFLIQEMSRNPNLLSKLIYFGSKVEKYVFLAKIWHRKIIKIVKKRIFDHCAVVFWLIWQQIWIPWLILR